jgi:DNA-binding response OmpR family regulator/DNA-binding CsgD family transcriptional regulator
MIVDDTPGNLALLSDMLSEADYRVLVATDGQSAIEQIHYLKPDIILLDVVMPGIDGFETCRLLKQDPSTAAIPILFMTGLSELDDLLRGFSEGGIDYIIKPIRPPEVLARIEVHLAQARNLQRTEQALQHQAFSALTCHLTGQITWLTPAAKQWFKEFAESKALSLEAGPGNLLPQQMISVLQKQAALMQNDASENADILIIPGFSIKLLPCHYSGEYLMTLHRKSTEWNIESMHSVLGLTLRETEILMWISRGKTNKEIGLILDGSPRTVNKHLEHAFEKLGVSTRAAAVAIALKHSGT